MKIGIMGGTFDPIHYGHLVAAEGACCQFEMEKVIFIPSANPPHKMHKKNISNPKCRLEMTSLAVFSNGKFEVSSLELERMGPSYTVDTLKIIKEIYKDAEIYFITGADAVLGIIAWDRVEELLQMATFVAATRPGFKLERLSQYLENIKGKENIVVMEVPALAISSTDIRGRVKEGKPIKYLLPEPVESYIYRTGLYKD